MNNLPNGVRWLKDENFSGEPSCDDENNEDMIFGLAIGDIAIFVIRRDYLRGTNLWVLDYIDSYMEDTLGQDFNDWNWVRVDDEIDLMGLIDLAITEANRLVSSLCKQNH